MCALALRPTHLSFTLPVNVLLRNVSPMGGSLYVRRPGTGEVILSRSLWKSRKQKIEASSQVISLESGIMALAFMTPRRGPVLLV